ncbi:unnamed protein product [Bursaphelenchus xylophilus]|uniref:(pine wood nematode) hypothetical protein n=1 Tax=Bursaphelenchus xylophilus TaxID=6326 RepID=A0A1I7SVA6_BURXY|nr:unnamed protein product [Bursaphelenchus xylophilus]CAG9101151.1 unnamed protein product [Bursaphelenchus xylophilus]
MSLVSLLPFISALLIVFAISMLSWTDVNMSGIFELRKQRVLEVFFTGGDLQFTQDGDTLFSTCGNILKALNVEDGSERFSIGDEEDPAKITSFKLFDDDKQLVVAYSNDVIKKFRFIKPDAPSLVHQFRTTHNGPVMVCAVQGSILLTGSSDFTTKVWNLQLNVCTHTLKGPSIVSAIEFLDEEKVLVGYGEGQVRMFDISERGGKHVKGWTNHSSRITSIIKKKSEGQNLALILSRDQTMTKIDIESGQASNLLPLFEPIESAVYVKKIDTLLTIGTEGILKFWHPTKAVLQAQYRITTKSLESILYNKKRNQLLMASEDQNLLFFDLETKKLVKTLSGSNDEILDVKYVSRETNLIAVATNSPQLRLYDLGDFNCTLAEGHTDTIMSVDAPSWDSNLLASASKGNSTIIWKVRSKEDAKENKKPRIEKIASATGHTNSVTGVRFSSHKNNAFCVTVSNDSTLKLWALKGIFGKKKESIVKLTADSTIVAHQKDITAVEVSQNDQLCATGSLDKTVKLWHVDKETMKFGIAGTLSGHRRGVWAVKFAKTTQSVLTGSGDYTLKLFSLLDLSCQRTFEGHTFAVLTVSFIKNEQQILSCDSNGLLKVWDTKTGVCEKTEEIHTDKVWAIESIPPSPEALEALDLRKREDLEKGGDGNVELRPEEYERYVSVGSDGKIIVWADVTDEIAAENARKEAERRAQIQTLENFLRLEKFSEALKLTLDLDHPFQCYKVLNKIIEKGKEQLEPLIAELNDDNRSKLIEFATQWNTNTRSYQTAQIALNAIFRTVPRKQLETLPNFTTQLEALLPYTRRHFERLQTMKENVSFVNYITSRMSAL